MRLSPILTAGFAIVLAVVGVFLLWRDAVRPVARLPAMARRSDTAATRPRQVHTRPPPPTDRAAGRFATLLQAVMTEPDAKRRDELISFAVGEVSDDEFAAALDLLRDDSAPEVAAELRVRLVRRWAESDPAAAGAWGERLPSGSVRGEVLSHVAIAWTNCDVAAAAAWASGLSAKSEANLTRLQVACEVIRTAPAVAIALACDLPPSDSRDDTLTQAAAEWASRCPTDAMAWADAIPQSGLRGRVVAAVAMARSENEPLGAARFALASISPGPALDDAVIGIAQRWVQRDPNAAAAWVATLTEETLRDSAIDVLAELWPKDPPKALRE